MRGDFSVTCLEKKRMHDKSYAKHLKFYKNEFRQYEKHLKIPLKARFEILEHVKSISEIMKKCDVSMHGDAEKPPMSDVYEIMLKFKDEGDPSTLDDMLISSKESCWSTVLFERTKEEIENEARRSAQTDVDLAEWREKKDAEDTEKRRKEEEEQKSRQKVEEEHRAKCEQDVADFQAKLEAERRAMRIWSENIRTSLDDIRKGMRHWYADDNLTEKELAAVKKYVSTLFAFTDAQNHGMTGLGLYAQNEARAEAHEEMLEVFGLDNNEYARELTKSYDFSDDYDFRTQSYKHLPDYTVVNMLGFALLEARKKGQ